MPGGAYLLRDLSSEDYSSEFKGYKFKIDHLVYSDEYHIEGILLDVEKPDGAVIQVQITENSDGLVDNLNLRVGCSSDGKDVVIYVWEASKQYMDLDVTGNVKDEPISVTVKDRVTGEPISNAKVKVSWSGMSIQGETEWGTGLFKFIPTQVGLYRIVVTKDGYYTATKTVTIGSS